MNSLTREDRALIDAAMAAGRVQVIPSGTSAYDYPVWTGTALRYPEGDTRRRTLGAAAFTPTKPAVPKVHGVLRRSQDRRRRMIEMISAGHLDVDIAADLGITLKWLRFMAAEAGVVLRSATLSRKPGHKKGGPRAPGALSKQVAALIAAGLSVADIVAETGKTRKVIRYHLGQLHRSDLLAADADASRAEMMQCGRDWLAQRAAGASLSDIAAAAGRSRSTVHLWMRRARGGPALQSTVAATAQRTAQQAKRRAEVARMFAAGLSCKVMAGTFGISMTTLRADLKALGLTSPRPRREGSHPRQDCRHEVAALMTGERMAA